MPAECTNIEINSVDGTMLMVRDHRPLDVPSPPTVLIAHGACEYGGRYEHIAGEFVERGWRVVVPDLRGHGRSGGTRTHVGSFQEYVADLEAVRNRLALNPDRTMLIGHSMGGLVAIRYCQRFPDYVAGLVLTSPLLGVQVPIPRTIIAIGKIMSYIAPRTRFQSRVDTADTTHDEQALIARENDPLVERSMTAGWFFAMRRAMRKAWDEAPRIELPTLILQAGADRIVDPVAPQIWLARTGSVDQTFQSFDGHFHELFNEPDWRETTAIVGDWIEAHLPATSSARSPRDPVEEAIS